MLVGQIIGEGDKAIAIDRELGSGAMGSVYRARFLKDDRVLALKIIAFGLADNEQARLRFEREGKILKQLKHPNITRLYATGQYRKTPFFAMEYVEGESLDKLFERRGKLPWEDIVRFGIQLCAALQHAHEKGIVHRDLKPSNIMIAKDGTLKLTDFGIAKDVDLTALTGANNTIGTAAYMSPEQCRGEKTLGPKSDLYSLGVVFYELVTGRKPFVKENAIDLFMAHVNDTFERPSRLVPNIPMWLDTLICQLMEKRPEMRPIDAAMVGRSLEEIAEKVATHKSVGQEVANARVIDRVQMTGPPDAGDREASRVIRSSAKRKRARKKVVPIYRRFWFSAILIGLLVGAMGYGAYALLKAPDPAIAFRAAMDEKDDERRQQLLAAFVKRYESTKGDDWQKAHEELLNLQAKKSDSAMWNRFRKHMPTESAYDKDAYDLVLKGFGQEREGEAKEAAETWKKLADGWADKPTDELLVWGWIGRRHLKLGRDVDDLERALRQKLDDARLNEVDATYDNDDAKKAAEALRAEAFGDATKATAIWKSMCGEAREKELGNDQREYAVLSARHFRAGEQEKAVPAAEREKMLRKKLADALALKASPNSVVQRGVRNTLRTIRDLYRNDPDPFPAIAAEAERELKSMK